MYLIIIGALLAGFFQSATGFGGAIVLMMFFPFFMPMKIASSIVGIIVLPMLLQLVFVYRKYIDYKKAFLMIPLFILSSTIAIQFAAATNMEQFIPFFGLFLIFLALYFSFFAKKIKMKPTNFYAALFAIFSGITGGLFGIGGPFIVLYYLEVIDDQKSYLGTVNFVFAIFEIYNAILRFSNGMIPYDMGAILALSFVVVLIGSWIGIRSLPYIRPTLMKNLIYILLAISGISTFVSSI